MLKKEEIKGAVLAEKHVRTWMRVLGTCEKSNSYTQVQTGDHN